jgi:hypothetical protein
LIAPGAAKCFADLMRSRWREETPRGTIVKIFLPGLAAAALAMFSTSVDAGVFYQSVPDLTVAPNIAEGSCSTCSGHGSQWTGEMFSLILK